MMNEPLFTLHGSGRNLRRYLADPMPPARDVETAPRRDETPMPASSTQPLSI